MSRSAGPPSESDAEFRPIGKHLVRVREDVIWVRSHGGLDLAEMRQLIDLSYTVADKHGYTLFLVDATQGGVTSPEARRYQAMRVKARNEPSHTAIYGASLLVRSLVSMTGRAIELVSGKTAPVSFHKDEAAASDRLDKERVLLSGQRKPR